MNLLYLQAWLTSATNTFQEVIESYNSSLRSCGNILDSKQQLLDDTQTRNQTFLEGVLNLAWLHI